MVNVWHNEFSVFRIPDVAEVAHVASRRDRKSANFVCQVTPLKQHPNPKLVSPGEIPRLRHQTLLAFSIPYRHRQFHYSAALRAGGNVKLTMHVGKTAAHVAEAIAELFCRNIAEAAAIVRHA